MTRRTRHCSRFDERVSRPQTPMARAFGARQNPRQGAAPKYTEVQCGSESLTLEGIAETFADNAPTQTSGERTLARCLGGMAVCVTLGVVVKTRA